MCGPVGEVFLIASIVEFWVGRGGIGVIGVRGDAYVEEWPVVNRVCRWWGAEVVLSCENIVFVVSQGGEWRGFVVAVRIIVTGVVH